MTPLLLRLQPVSLCLSISVCLSLSLCVCLCVSWCPVVSFVLIAAISVERSCDGRSWQWEGFEGVERWAITRHHGPRALMKTDAMDAAAAAEAGSDRSAAGNIVVGSQLQIVGVVSTRSMTDWPTEPSHSVLLECRQTPASITVQPGRGLIPGGHRCRGLTAGDVRGDDGDDDDDVTRNDPQRAATSTRRQK